MRITKTLAAAAIAVATLTIAPAGASEVAADSPCGSTAEYATMACNLLDQREEMRDRIDMLVAERERVERKATAREEALRHRIRVLRARRGGGVRNFQR